MTVWAQIAEKLRDHARDSGGTEVQRYRVLRANPLLLDQVDGDERLEEGDDDFTITDSLRLYRTSHGLPSGTIVRVLATAEEFLAIDAESDRDL